MVSGWVGLDLVCQGEQALHDEAQLLDMLTILRDYHASFAGTPG